MLAEEEDTRPNRTKLQLIEEEQREARKEVRSLHESVRAMLTSNAQLMTRIDRTLLQVEQRGWTRWPVIIATASAAVLAAIALLEHIARSGAG